LSLYLNNDIDVDYIVYAPEEMLMAKAELPLSKSISARVLVMDALARLYGGYAGALPSLADCDDTQVLMNALGFLRAGSGGSRVESQESGGLMVDGQGPGAEWRRVDVGAAGTAMRFATAFFAALPGCRVLLDGNGRMRRRPVGVLVDALRALGADIEYAGDEGFPPLKITGCRLSGGDIDVDASVSSQFLSALAMVGPVMSAPLVVRLQNSPASLPYLRMTVRMMQDCGIDADIEGMTLRVRPGVYTPPAGYSVEADWSAASYWYAIAALSAGWVTLPGLRAESLQGDAMAAEYGRRLGVVSNFDAEDEETGEKIDGVELSASPEVFSRLDADMSPTPDLVQTFAMASAMLGVPFRFSGVHTLRDKETDRIEALINEAYKLGFDFESEGDDVLLWDGRRHPVMAPPEIETYGDHRMAMSFAPCAIYASGMVIKDVEVVNKSYPEFWEQLRAAGFTLAETTADMQEGL